MTVTQLYSRAVLGASLLAALAASVPAWAQQELGRVISSTPISSPDGTAGYSVTYEYAGRQYSTRTDSPPGDHIAVQVTPMGVMAPQAQDAAPMADNNYAPAQPWRNASPEPGMVVSGGAVPPPDAGYPAPAPVYMAPAPVYVAPGYGYGYGYGYPYAYPPVGVSLNLGYTHSRGWRGWH